MRIDTAGRKAVRQPRPVVKVTGINKEKIHILLERDIFHMRYKGRKVTQITTVIDFWGGCLLVAKQPASDGVKTDESGLKSRSTYHGCLLCGLY